MDFFYFIKKVVSKLFLYNILWIAIVMLADKIKHFCSRDTYDARPLRGLLHDRQNIF
jgi:hypothetical protein